MARQRPSNLLRQQWSKKAQALPPGGRLEFDVFDDHVWLHIVQLPPECRGGKGTRLLAELLAVADQVGLSVSLTADPTDRGVGDPGVYDLVRWYSKFGFKLYALDNDRVALMERPVGSKSATPDRLVAEYKRAIPAMTAEQFETWEADQLRKLGIEPQPIDEHWEPSASRMRF